MLALALHLEHDESPASHCSRLALRCGCSSSSDFCHDAGMTFSSVVSGKQASLERLAQLGGVSLEQLTASAIRKTGSVYCLGNSALALSTLRRTRMFVCPCCISSDIERNRYLGTAAPVGRSSWQIAPMRTCPIHNVVLVDVTEWCANSSYADRNDFAFTINNMLANGGSALRDVRDRDPSALERYLFNRLDGGPRERESWLDHMPFYAAAKASEMVGAVERHGIKVSLETLTDDEWWEAGHLGFGILQDGPEAFRRFLENIQPGTMSMIGDPRQKAMFGKLSIWLGDITDDEVYDPLREIMRDTILDTLAIPPGTEILGDIVDVRRLHSIRSAGDQIGWTYERLRKVLQSAGFINHSTEGLSFDAVVFPADQRLEEFLCSLQSSLTMLEAAKHLNATRIQAEQLLSHGFIIPIAQGGEEGLNNYAFAKEHLDDFLNVLMAKVAEVDAPDEWFEPIPLAGKRAHCQNIDIIRLILDGRISAARSRGTSGYRSILVDASEVLSVLLPTAGMELSIAEVQTQTGWSRPVTKGVLALGIIPSKVVLAPKGGMPRWRVLKADLHAFDRRFIHFTALAKELGISHQSINHVLAKAKVRPAFDSQGTPAIFYRREDVQFL